MNERQRSATKPKWIRRVQARSDAMDLEEGVFRLRSPRAMARSLLRSVRRSRRRRGTVLSSGISMLTYYLNRAGTKLPAERRRNIMAAKGEYRHLAGNPKPTAGKSRRGLSAARR